MADETTPTTSEPTTETAAANDAATTAAAPVETQATEAQAEAKPAGRERGPDGKFVAKKADDAAEPAAEQPADAGEAIDYAKALSEGLPEGQEVDKALLEAVHPILAEHKIPIEAAVALRDAYAGAIAQNQTAAASAWGETVKGWEAAIKADPDYGGKALDQTKSDAAFVLDTYGSPELRQALDQFGFGNHPELIKALARTGRELRAAGIEPGSAPVKAADPYKVLYPNSPELHGKN